MDKIAVLPMLLGFALLASRSPRELFVFYFIPILLVFPVYYDTKLVQGIPELSFWSAALAPILAFWVFQSKCEGYVFSWLDVIILLHLLIVFYGQYVNSSYKPAQKVLFNDLMARFFPYLLTRVWFSDPEVRIDMIKAMVVVGSVVGLFMMYEFKLWYNVFDKPIRKLWPHWVPWELPMKRWGLKRAFGPFAHPICGGYFFAMIAPMALWLWKENRFATGVWNMSKTKDYWGPKTMLAIVLIPFLLVPADGFKSIGLGAVALGLLFVFLLFYGLNRTFKKLPWGLVFFSICSGGCIASISRAPIAGMFLGFALIWFGWARRKAMVFGIMFLAMCASLPVVVPKIVAYVNVDRATAETADQRNAAYRKELMDNYKEVVAEKPWFGWGRFTVPVVKGQLSIDNEFLFMTLTSGKAAFYAYVLLIAYIFARLLNFVRSQPYDSSEGRLAWALLAGWTAAVFTQTTVYAGTQTVQFFYMCAGIGEALVSSRATAVERTQETGPAPAFHAGNFGFVRTLGASGGLVPMELAHESSKEAYGYRFSRTL